MDPALGALSLARTQQRIVAESRHGIPALAHEECLAGFAAWGATAYPVPLSWGATFDPALIERMAARIGADMASVGVHQGLAPVLDVVRDARWGRVEETIGEDPYLVGTVGTAYVRGLESAGIVATLKHFVGYSASQAGRNLAPVSIGPRELADVLLPPFEMAMRDGRPRSVMNSYTDIDGVPAAADAALLTGLLRDTWGFDGTVVADYFAIAFLKTAARRRRHLGRGRRGRADRRHRRRAADRARPSASRCSTAGPRRAARRGARRPRAAAGAARRRRSSACSTRTGRRCRRRSRGREPRRPGGAARHDRPRPAGEPRARPRDRRAGGRAAAQRRRAAAARRRSGSRVIGPNADDPYACSAATRSPRTSACSIPRCRWGSRLPTLLEALRAEFPDAEIVIAPGTTIDGGDTDGIPARSTLAAAADVVVLALGDRAGLFGRGTSGEGCDVESLDLPGAQQQLLDAVLATGTPVVVTLLLAAGRTPSARAVTEAAAIVQTFFPGEEGGPAIAGVLSGRVNPSGRLPVSVPAHPGAQPSTYLAAPLGQARARCRTSTRRRPSRSGTGSATRRSTGRSSRPTLPRSTDGR